MDKKVRLKQFEIDAICNSFKKSFLAGDELWLFGSRADINKKGGDIDLFIKTNYKDAKEVVKAKMNLLYLIFMTLEEQKIDVVIEFNDFHLPIYDIAKEEGVRLV
jgi:predicted nucleotidyltransferase